ncbi:unnamed protein product [Gongylonema pulchrum]|uniref:PPM-type phosphatase domain-containing protein n=1 Tax=Gongylonema pulchrum TaxID=637853 RepID=A0A183DET4_9BILA|nr:unnamed protein product [Gongylonema pulchrum]
MLLILSQSDRFVTSAVGPPDATTSEALPVRNDTCSGIPLRTTGREARRAARDDVTPYLLNANDVAVAADGVD